MTSSWDPLAIARTFGPLTAFEEQCLLARYQPERLQEEVLLVLAEALFGWLP